MFVLEAAFVLVLFIGITAYQTRNLLDTDRKPAPALIATTLEDASYDLSQSVGRPALIYFFAPWCRICAASADNVERLRRWRDEEDLEILVVALDWQDQREVEEYVRKHGLDMPVLLAGPSVAYDWKVPGFPTYYVLDSEHKVVRRDFGYSTQFGLWWRTWLVK